MCNSINVDALITIGGLSVWVVTNLGYAFGIATIPPQVNDVGMILFGIGIRGAVNHAQNEDAQK